MKTINEALAHVQKHLKAPKSQTNKFGGYTYRSCEDILLGLKAVMPDGATVVISDEVVVLSDRFYIVATATFSFAGEAVSAKGWAREEASKKGMSDSQLTGSCSSYARKYALNGLFSIDDSKDADTEAPPEENPIAKPSLMFINALMAAYSRGDCDEIQKIMNSVPKAEKVNVWAGLTAAAKDWIKHNVLERGK